MILIIASGFESFSHHVQSNRAIMSFSSSLGKSCYFRPGQLLKKVMPRSQSFWMKWNNWRKIKVNTLNRAQNLIGNWSGYNSQVLHAPCLWLFHLFYIILILSSYHFSQFMLIQYSKLDTGITGPNYLAKMNKTNKSGEYRLSV